MEASAGVPLAVGWLVVSGQPIGLWVTGGFRALIAVPLPWRVGLHLRNAAALEQAGWEKARILGKESRLVAERARTRERSRIAGDLHDAVGHELSLPTLRAGRFDPGDGPGDRGGRRGLRRA
ncbi:histidine kinase [Nocardiopsis xinjiangensis]|uniref:histidine kinase n=1 Tax=Nocardiopsis xinjiangensis TaxID=124285 RepID=UPI000344B756|nr:histidine kinase [Nocardiopsis xinjiangensis]